MAEMTTEHAETLGREARRAGVPSDPRAHPAMFAELAGAVVGSKTHLMQAYSRGWNAEDYRITDADIARLGLA